MPQHMCFESMYADVCLSVCVLVRAVCGLAAVCTVLVHLRKPSCWLCEFVDLRSADFNHQHALPQQPHPEFANRAQLCSLCSPLLHVCDDV